MSERLKATPLSEFSVPSLGRATYRLELGIPFGCMHVSPVVFTLTWPGSLDFKQLDDELLGRLSRRVAGVQVPRERLYDATVASFMVAEDIVTYRLNDLRDLEQYNGLLAQPTEISFARYDIGAEREEPMFAYSVTAENQQFLPNRQAEIAIQLPRKQRFSEELCKWVLRHHIDGSELGDRAKPDEIAAALTNLGTHQRP